MTDPILIPRNGHRTWLKWHRGRRRASDPVFTGARIAEAMRLGASVEIDLVITGDKGLAVLHDKTLDRETTGQGLVATTGDAMIRQLYLRDNDGLPIADPVMLLDDLCAMMASGSVHPDALLQLDFKEDDSVLDARAIERFALATRPFAKNLVVSSGNARAVRLLADAVPGMMTGYDASDEGKFKSALANGRLEDFVTDAIATAPDVEMIYLYWEIITGAADAGFDMAGAFQKHGKRVDAWTIRETDAASVAVVERLLELKVDQITTDDPEGLFALIG